MNNLKRKEILKSFTVGEIYNPITYLTVQNKLEQADLKEWVRRELLSLADKNLSAKQELKEIKRLLKQLDEKLCHTKNNQ